MSAGALLVSERIRQRLGSLSRSEQRVARLLLSGSPTLGLESSARLARHAGVSGPTVSRFVINQLGFDNYAAFQDALREEISDRVMSPVELYRQRRADQPPSELLASGGASLGDAVLGTVRGLDPAEFERAATLLADRRRSVLAIGGWFSHLIADYLVLLLREIRPGVRFVPPVASERAAALADLTRRDVVAVFDFRRYERDTREFALAARAAGAAVVLFTDPWISPVAEVADALLPAQVSGPSPFENLTPTVAVVEIMLTAVADALGENARSRFERFGGLADRWMRPWQAGG